jgi:hypothetical protein
MKHDTAIDLLDDYVDGELEPSRAEALETHVQGCVACRRELDMLRKLLDGAAALPRSIEPSKDLWPEIASAVQFRQEPEAPAGSGVLQRLGFFSWSWPTALATAAVVGVLLISSLDTDPKTGLTKEAQMAELTALAETDPEAAALLRALEAESVEYDRELAAYTAGQTGPGTVTRMLRENMPVVEQAIAEAREAWMAAPEEPGLARLLTSAYRAKMALQGRAIRMASAS